MKQEFTDQEPSTAFEPTIIRSCRSCPEDNRIDDTENMFLHEKNCLNGWNSPEVVLTPGAPWARRIYQPTIDSLNDEILDLYQWLRPNPLEILYRRNVFCNVANVIMHLWPQAKCCLFGSVATNLFLPSSDIDISVQLEPGLSNAELSPYMHHAAKAFRHTDFFEKIAVLDKAFVPIIKLTDKHTQLNIDISFNTVRSMPTVEWIEKAKQKFPVLEPLVLVLKQFLAQRDLNQPFNGGLSSYALIVMVVHYLKLQMERYEHRQINEAKLGILFLNFLKYFGCDFDYANMALRIRNGMSEIVPKEELTENMHEFKHSSILCLEDPLDPENDIGRGAHNMMIVKKEFETAYNALTAAPKRLKEEFNEEQLKNTYTGPLLKVIIEILPRQVNERNYLRAIPYMHPVMGVMGGGDAMNNRLINGFVFIPVQKIHNPRFEVRASSVKSKGFQNGLSFSPVICTSVTPHDPNLINHHANHPLPPQQYIYWNNMPIGPPPSLVQMPMISPTLPPYSIAPVIVPAAVITSNGPRRYFHGRSASFSHSSNKRVNNFRSCKSPSTSSSAPATSTISMLL